MNPFDNPPQGLPPPYSDTKSLNLCIKGGIPNVDPATFRMVGESRTPDFTIHAPGGGRSPPLYKIETTSTLILHETIITDTRSNGICFTIKRKQIAGGSTWLYSSETRGARGVKILEMETDGRLLAGKGGSARLVFRNAADGELAALDVSVVVEEEGEGDIKRIDLRYRGSVVAQVVQEGSTRTPEYALEICLPGVDPLLVAVVAVVVDDRSMTQRRRLRSPLLRGFPGVGKGPGAGLAGAYALGSV